MSLFSSEKSNLQNPLDMYPKPPYKVKKQTPPGSDEDMNPKADHGETSYKGAGKLTGRKAIITGADSGIGRAIQNFTAVLGQLWAEKGIRVNCVAPGPVWTPLIPSTMPPEEVEKFGEQTPMKRAGQPVELAPAYVLLASQESSYMTASTIQVTGGTPTI